MPTYVYGCDVCGHRFEKSQRFSDDPIKVCPECEGKVRRIFQPAGIVFKGSGWHTTDYKRNGKTDGDGAKADSTSKDEGAKTGADKDTKAGAAKEGSANTSAKESSAKESTASSGSSDGAKASPAT